jgi:hypothetical protein
MTDKQYYQQTRQAAKVPFSPFAKWHDALKGLDLFIDGKQQLKFVVWEKGYKDASRILSNNTIVKFKPKKRETNRH